MHTQTLNYGFYWKNIIRFYNCDVKWQMKISRHISLIAFMWTAMMVMMMIDKVNRPSMNI